MLKGKKIGGLEDKMNGMVDDTLTGEVSDEEEATEIYEEHHRNDSIRHRSKVLFKYFLNIIFFVPVGKSVLRWQLCFMVSGIYLGFICL